MEWNLLKNQEFQIPKRLFKAYSQSASTLNLIRAFSHGGFADLKKVHTWNLGFIKNTPTAKKFKELEDRIADALAFMDACGINSDFNRRLKTVNFWTSHEALLLPFEAGNDKSRLYNWRIS